jgi:hypothetical protein
MLPLAVFATDSPSTDKSNYSLFNPVPADQLRPLSSDAYDGVMDACTLDAGHYQVEGEFINYFYNSVTPYRYYSNEFAWEPRITVGLLNNLDFFVHPTYEIRLDDYKVTSSEFGRIATGVKVNLLGNDGGMIALAIKPYLSIPTSDSDALGGGGVLGGGDVALLMRLPQGFSVKFDSEFHASQKDNRTPYAGFYNAMSINKTLCSKANAYWYLDSTVTSDSTETWYGYTGVGLEYNFTRNLQVFAGFGFGLAAPDWVSGQIRPYDYNPRAGFVWRL